MAPLKSALPNPVVWMDVLAAGSNGPVTSPHEVAETARGRLHFELFQDAAPLAAGNFRQLCLALKGYQGTAVDLVYAGRYVTLGDVDAAQLR